MQDSLIPDETDLKIIHAVQADPRAAWRDVGTLLKIDPATAARRWQALRDARLVQVTAYPTVATWAQDHCNAFIELDIEPAARGRAVRELAQVPQIVAISVISSGRDLFLTVLTSDLEALSDLVLRRLHGLAGVRGTRTCTATTVYGEGADWRFGSLAAQSPPRPPRAPARNGAVWKPRYRELLRELADGRRTAADIAKGTGQNPATVRRWFNELVDANLISFRCEVARHITGRPIAATFWARVPPDLLDRTGAALSTLPEVRLCAAVTGSDNLVMTLWLRSLGDIQRFEVQLARKLPHLTLTDRAVTLHQAKRMGCLLDDTGRITGVVPIDPWAPDRPGERPGPDR
ncbi:Lrp/AsnC family transcriptional regulator [Actinosynnema sp. NPDC047251]|uniref:Transcriptional regulator, AsnC family n=1 Tax=Saccharothrix espanaensis (strain ATCC 51144 / DSM 44229 / JCM 9112 / NBRC 15066 / NRRL 15764) TaxID=1179773 RepID=K0K8V9_SACES|nr:Lrp/AsnC family transcriptional regulator [Saccharothrix espanaensis]CCH33279.1 Transcriptional regulator, AsnC family [Saccharothrix espanaensis DSM 44229]